jgi:GTP-binding protein
MRREGYELQVGQPKVLLKTLAGKMRTNGSINHRLTREVSGKAIELVTGVKANS